MARMPAQRCTRYMRSSPPSGRSSQAGRTARSMISDISAKATTPLSRMACLRKTQISKVAGGSSASASPNAANTVAMTMPTNFIWPP